MKTTPNLISGELMIIEKQMRHHIHDSYARMYSKAFYDKHFVKALGRQLTYKHMDKNINVSATEDDYILEVKPI
ncbi:hypothetical protein [Salinicoccus carnicancri]|uniref:hypothetical protein n=1 Tax=Salinicoccus carnicancri TaxID=558170 RepID=UPI00031717DF|nr:hypothetical protein [Salinicoccus carnicancri]